MRPYAYQHRVFSSLQLFWIFLLTVSLTLGGTSQMAQAAPLQDPTAEVSIGLPAEGMIGEQVTLTVAFNNNGADPNGPGYGPFIDVILPATGMDGDDGLIFREGTDTVKYLGYAVNYFVYLVDDTGCITHPYAVDNAGTPVEVCGLTEGDQFLAIELPFGSFVPDQPPAPVTITALMSDMADVADDNSANLTVQARGGYRFGLDEMDNPAADPSIVGNFVPREIKPTLIRLEKIYQGPEDETATGPNFPRQYTINVDIAAGQTLYDFDLTDYLDNNLEFLSLIAGSTTPGYTVTVSPTTGGAQNPPNNELTLNWASVTGTAADVDVRLTFEFFVPQVDADGDYVLPPLSGDDRLSTDDALAGGDWLPVDPRDRNPEPNPRIAVSSNLTTEDHILTDKSIAIQKGVSIAVDNYATGPTSGDILAYTLTFQISDYFAFDNLVITDVISDGQHFDDTRPVRLVIDTPESPTLAVDMDAANYTVTPHYTPDGTPPIDGTTTLEFRVSDEMETNSLLGRMVGGCVPGSDTSTTWGTGGGDPDCTNGNYGATTGTLTFYTEILEDYTDDFPSGVPSIVQGDVVDNDVDIVGALLAVEDLSPILSGGNPVTEADDSAAATELPTGEVLKTLYAVNGVVGGPARVAAGDTVTYRIKYELPTGDVENLHFVDYLPLPIFRVGDPDADSATAGPAWSFDNTISAAAPPVGVVKFGPDNNFKTLGGMIIVPANLIPTSAENSLEIFYGNHDDALNIKQTIDLLFTIAVQSDPFADGLYLTNQVQAREQNTWGVPSNTTDIIQIEITEPRLEISKGVVAADQGTFAPTSVGPVPFATNACPRFAGTINSTNLAANPINSNLSGADAGDTVYYAVVIENTGSGVNGVYDVQLSDTLAAKTSYVANSLCVTDGTGAPILATALGGAALTDGSELFGTGIELVDPGPPATPAGALDPFNATSGRNIAVVTYAVTLDADVNPRQILRNTATLSQYAGREGGVDYLPAGKELTDDATVTVKNPTAAKTLTGTEFTTTNNSATQATIGETVDYQVTITVPEGTTPDFRVLDNLDGGLAFVSCLSVEASAPTLVTTNLAGGFASACAPIPPPGDPATGNPAITNNARRISFNLGDVTNTDEDNATPETITLKYRAVVLNNTSTNHGNSRGNSAVVSWTGSALPRVRASVGIVEPLLNINKSVSVDGVPGGGGDAGDPVEYTIRLTQTNNRPHAYDVTFSDALPVSSVSGRSLIIGALTDTSVAPGFTVADTGTTPLTVADFEMVGSYATGWTLQTLPGSSFDFEPGARTITLTVTGFISNNAADVRVGDTIKNIAKIDWTSLDGTPGVKSDYSTDAVERTGAGGLVNDYLASDDADILIDAPEVGKTITATNQAFTLPNAAPFGPPVNVAVGETVSYQVVYTIPEGIAFDFGLTDILDPGLAFVSCDSITFDPALQLSRVFTCDDAVISAFPSATDPQNAGRQMSFSLGDITNNATDLDPETVVLNYTVVVLNSEAVNAGATLKNTAAASWAFFPDGPRQTQQLIGPLVTVVEPILSVQKDAIITSGATTDAGETVEYTIVLTHAAGSTTDAFEAQFSDPLPVVGGTPLIVAPVSLTVVDSAGTLAGTAFELVGNDTTGWTVRTTGSGFDFPLDPTRTVTLTVTGTLSGAVSPDQVITNTAEIDWSSLPGGVTAPQTSNNTLSCERTGDQTDGVCGAAYNDYSAADPADVTVDSPAIAKVLYGTSAAHTLLSEVTIGEVVTYDLQVTFPEGTSSNVSVLDAIPAGMAYVGGSASVVTTAADSPLTEDFNGTTAGFSASLAVDGADGEDVTFSFTSVSVASDASTDNNALVIRFQARVLDVPGNVGVGTQTTLNNSATLQINGGTSYPSGQVQVTVVEPRMEIVKEFYTEADPVTLPPAVDADTAANNDTVIVTFSVTNSGTSDAFEVVVKDPLPTARFDSITELTTPTGFTFGWAVVGTDTVITYTGGSIAAGETIYFSYQATVRDLAAGVTYTNTATVTQATTLPGTDPGERDEPDVDGSDDLVGIAPDLVLTKDDNLVAVQAGDTVVYTIRVQNVGGRDASGVTITDTIPLNTTFAGTSGWTCLPDGNPASLCTYVIGALAAGGSVDVPFGLVIDNPVPASVETITNLASVADDGTHGDDPTPENNEDDDVDTLNAAPDLTITKDDGGITTAPDGVVVYTLTYANVGTQDATGVVITETVPANTTFSAAGSTTGWSCADGAAAGTTCTFTVGALPGRIPPNPAVYQTVAFAVKVDGPTLAAGIDEVNNTVSIGDDGDNGEDPTPEDNEDDDDTPIDAAPDLTLTKDDGDATTLPGGTVVYTLTYANVGDQDATGVVITETVPANTTFNAAGSTATWSCADGAAAGTTCTFTVGNLAAGAGGSVNFAVTVNNPLPASVTQINNTARVADDGDNGPDPTPTDNEDDDDTPLEDVETVPDLTITKSDGGARVAPGGTVVYTLTYANVGTQEATNVVITETVPANTTFNADSSSTGWSCLDGDSAGTVCTLTLASVAGGGAGSTLDFAVNVDNPLPAGIEEIYNAVSITDDGTNGEDPTPEDNEDDDDTPVDAAPDLSIVKDDGVEQVAPGERLTYTLTITNTGNQHATGVEVVDTLPEHTTYVSSQRVDTAQPGTYDDAAGEVSWVIGNLAVGDSLTFTIVVDVDDPLDENVTSIDNTAVVSDDGENGDDPTPEDNEDTDSDAIRGASKRLVSSANHPYNVLPEVSIGEVLTYEVELTVAGTATIGNVVLTDTLDRGLALLDVVSIEPRGIVAAPEDFPAIQAGAVFGALGSDAVDQGRRLTMNFGTLINPLSDDAVLRVTYRAVVLDYPPQGSGDRLNNEAVWTWDGGTLTGAAREVEIVEPELSLCKQANTSVAQKGDLITFTVTVSPMPEMETAAFDVVVEDTIPNRMKYVAGSLRLVSGKTPTVLDDSAVPLLRVGWDEILPSDEPAVLEFQARIVSFEPGQKITNTAVVRWSSLPGDFSDPQSTHNTLSTERDYDPQDPVCIQGKLTNSYTIRYPLSDELPATGFAPNRVTAVRPQPESLRYQDLGRLWLEIPKLAVKRSIVGVPQNAEGWSLDWLGGQVGYLGGTAFPGWAGNTGLTAHVYDANGEPGPFVHLGQLKWGDQIIVHYQGERYTYEVRSVDRVLPKNMASLKHEEQPWVTLITCQGYNELNDAYNWRLVVRAVQVAVERE